MSVAGVALPTAAVDTSRSSTGQVAGKAGDTGNGFAALLGASRRNMANTNTNTNTTAHASAGHASARALPGAGPAPEHTVAAIARAGDLPVIRTDVDAPAPGGRELEQDRSPDAAMVWVAGAPADARPLATLRAGTAATAISSAQTQTLPADAQPLPGALINTGVDTPLVSGGMRLVAQAASAAASNGVRLQQSADNAAAPAQAGLGLAAAIAPHTPAPLPAELQPLETDAGFATMRAGLRRVLSERGDALEARSVPAVHAASPAAVASSPQVGVAGVPAPAAAVLTEPLASQAWNRTIAGHSLRLHHEGGGRAELQLHPRELGTLQISLQLGEQSQLHVASPHAHVRAALEAALPQLRQAFADNGITLGDTSVGDQTPRQQDDPNAQRRHPRASVEAAGGGVETAGQAGARIAPATPRALMGIDIFA